MGRYAILKRFEIMREEFVFPEKLPMAYAYPSKKPPKKLYRGLGREERDLFDPLAPALSPGGEELIAALEEGETPFSALWESREKTLLYAASFGDAEDYEIVYLASPDEKAPEDLLPLGFDAGYAPEEELFSAVSDLFFFPLWRPDGGGKAFLREFESLNGNGLFSSPGEALALIHRYEETFGDDSLLPLAVYALPEE